MLDLGVEMVDRRLGDRCLTNGAKREIREAYRNLAGHFLQEGGTESDLWKRNADGLEEYAGKLAKGAAEAQGSEGDIGSDAMRLAIKSSKDSDVSASGHSPRHISTGQAKKSSVKHFPKSRIRKLSTWQRSPSSPMHEKSCCAIKSQLRKSMANSMTIPGRRPQSKRA